MRGVMEQCNRAGRLQRIVIDEVFAFLPIIYYPRVE
jgi:hypothetical protein